VKTVDTWAELGEALKLRYEVFHRELLNKKIPFGSDREAFDPACDHLVIVDRRVDKIVGTYRLLSSSYANAFYSQTEFSLASLLSRPGTKLELSRACIHRDYRDGVVIHLLWRGVAQYIQQVEAKFLFGCASVKTTDERQAGMIFRYLEEKGHVGDEFDVAPLKDFEVSGFRERFSGTPQSEAEAEEAKRMIPPLLYAYLRAGAKIYGAPALDKDFQCFDFLTVLKLESLTKLFERKYVIA
jgi:putative hemolysin